MIAHKPQTLAKVWNDGTAKESAGMTLKAWTPDEITKVTDELP